MLRLLFCTAAIIPIAILPWATEEADAIEADVVDASYAELVRDPSIAALSQCESGELPIFFHDELVTTHSAEFIHEGLEATQDCGAVTVEIVPVLPVHAETEDLAESLQRTAELREIVRLSGMEAVVSPEPQRPEGSSLYLNGRAAILRIEPDTPG